MSKISSRNSPALHPANTGEASKASISCHTRESGIWEPLKFLFLCWSTAPKSWALPGGAISASPGRVSRVGQYLEPRGHREAHTGRTTCAKEMAAPGQEAPTEAAIVGASHPAEGVLSEVSACQPGLTLSQHSLKWVTTQQAAE